MNFLQELNQFILVCNSFYDLDKGIYPIATKEQIENAIGEYLTSPHTIDIQFDSIDREKVREILQPEYNWAGVNGGIY
jgi:hypothetical protein